MHCKNSATTNACGMPIKICAVEHTSSSCGKTFPSENKSTIIPEIII